MHGRGVADATDPRSSRRYRGKPEGPYEDGDQQPAFGVSSHELARLLDFIEQFESEIEQTLTIRTSFGEMRMLVALLRDHLTGKLTTSSSLVAHSGMTYGTAMRTIASLIERGLIVKRPRTNTGKSYSLHPTEDMLLEWQELARRSDSLVATLFGTRGTASPNLSDYFFGASYASSSVLPPPCILATKLPIKNALRVLVHADPTFMAMHVLKKQFENGVRRRHSQSRAFHRSIARRSSRQCRGCFIALRFDRLRPAMVWRNGGRWAFAAARCFDEGERFRHIGLSPRSDGERSLCRQAIRHSPCRQRRSFWFAAVTSWRRRA